MKFYYLIYYLNRFLNKENAAKMYLTKILQYEKREKLSNQINFNFYASISLHIYSYK